MLFYNIRGILKKSNQILTEDAMKRFSILIAALCLCLCWELPRVLLLLAAGFGGGMAAVLPELLSGLALCCIGGMGLACTGQGKTGND